MLKFSNTEAFWNLVAKTPLAFGASRTVEIIDPPYTFAGFKKWFGKADLTGIIFCVAFSGQRQHSKRIVTAIKGHLRTLASTHDEFAVTVRNSQWELSDGNTRALLYKALLLQKMGLLTGDIPVEYSYDDLPIKVRAAFTETATVEESLSVYHQYNSREAVKTSRDATHTALKMTAAEFSVNLQSEFFRNEGAIATASEYAFFTGRAKPELAVKVLQPVLVTLDSLGLTRRVGAPTSLPGGAVAALAVLAGVDGLKSKSFADAVFATDTSVDNTDSDVTLPQLFAYRLKELKAAHQFSSAAGLRPAVSELVGIVLAYADAVTPDMKVSKTFLNPITVSQLQTLAETKYPLLAAVFKHRDTLSPKIRVTSRKPKDLTTVATTADMFDIGLEDSAEKIAA